jgi:hypothetical protein
MSKAFKRTGAGRAAGRVPRLFLQQSFGNVYGANFRAAARQNEIRGNLFGEDV